MGTGGRVTAEEKILLIKQAVEAQANDETLWFLDPSIEGAYLQQSLRWLHKLIEENDEQSLTDIINQSTGDI